MILDNEIELFLDEKCYFLKRYLYFIHLDSFTHKVLVKYEEKLT